MLYKLQIDYKIYLPTSVHIDIENKYGDIFMEDQLGRATIKLSNGDLRAQSFQGPTSLSLEFAYANIKKLANGNISMDHRSELRLDEADELKITSRSSRATLGTIQKLDIKSHRDKYSIEKVADLSANNNYTYLVIYTLGKSLTVDAKYGSIDINAIEGIKSTEAGPSDRIEFKLDYTLPVSKTDKFEAGLQSRTGNSGDYTEMYTLQVTSNTYEIDNLYSRNTDYNRNIFGS